MIPVHNPYAAPAAAAADGGVPGVPGVRPYYAALEGDALVVSKDAALPSVCLKCGTHEGISRRTARFQWTPRWARLMVVFCTLPGAIAMLVTTKRATMQVPLCAPCNARWGQAVAALIAAVVLLVGALMGMSAFEDQAPALGLLFAAIVAFVIVALAFVKPRMLQVKRIDDRNVTLAGFAPDAARVIVFG